MKIPWPSLTERIYSKKSARALTYEEITWFFDLGVLCGRPDISPEEKTLADEEKFKKLMELFPERRNKTLSADRVNGILAAHGLDPVARNKLIGEVFGG